MAKPFVFTLMPFDKSFDDIYKLGIKATCEEAGAYCERVDEQKYQGSILDRIMNQISKADVVIGDMSGKNPNVFFEVGYAKALDKKIILLTSDASDIPFDLRHYSHLIYNNSILKLKENLKGHLEHYLSNLGNSASEMMFGLNFYILGNRLIEEEVTEVTCPGDYRYVPLSVVNVSGKMMPPNSLLLTAKNVETKDTSLLFHEHEEKRHVIDQDGQGSWSINNESPLFNGSTESYTLCRPFPKISESRTVHLSAFTESGKRTYTIKIMTTEKPS